MSGGIGTRHGAVYHTGHFFTLVMHIKGLCGVIILMKQTITLTLSIMPIKQVNKLLLYKHGRIIIFALLNVGSLRNLCTKMKTNAIPLYS